MIPKVYFIPLEDGASAETQAEAVKKLYEVCEVEEMINPNEYTAIKLHVGEKNNTTHIVPQIAAVLTAKIKEKDAFPFLTETATLYRCERDNAVKHIMHANAHGFGIDQVGAPFIMADGLAGDAEIEVEINGELNRSVMVARDARMTDNLIVVTHPTGHLVSGYGGTIKNLGMGLTSRKGKLKQHSLMKPEINSDKCVLCGKCIKWCPENAISEKENSAFIDKALCIGCGECLAVCRFSAVLFDWGMDSTMIQKHMAEHALGVVKDKQDKFFYFNICMNMTSECDCMNINQKKIIPDLGILASKDPVAIDEASLDLSKHDGEKDLAQRSFQNLNGRTQLEYAEKIGLGSRKYQLVKVSLKETVNQQA